MADARLGLDTYLKHRAALIDYAAPIVGDRHQAEDVVQEAWLRIADSSVHQRGPIAQPASYLYRVVRNLAIDLSRRMAPEVRGEDAEMILALAPERAADPETRAIERNELDMVLAAIEELPERTRTAFHMHRFQNATYAAIGAALGISQARAHNLVAEAVAHCMRRVMDGPA